MTLDIVTVAVFFAAGGFAVLIGRPFMRTNNKPDTLVGHRKKNGLAFGSFTDPLARVFPTAEPKQKKLRKDLLKAGFYHRGAEVEFLALRNAAMMVWMTFVVLFAVVAVGNHDAWLQKLWLGGAVGLVFIYGLPTIVLSFMASARAQRIQTALPDAIDMMTMTMSAGMPMQQAIKHVSRQLDSTHPDLACELTVIGQQTEARSLDHALAQFGERIDLPDVQALTALVRHTDRLGINVATAFRDYADSVRRSRRQRAEERGNKASVKLIFPIVFCLAPPVYVLLLGPAVLELRDFFVRENQPGGVLTSRAATAQLDTNGPMAPRP